MQTKLISQSFDLPPQSIKDSAALSHLPESVRGQIEDNFDLLVNQVMQQKLKDKQYMNSLIQ